MSSCRPPANPRKAKLPTNAFSPDDNSANISKLSDTYENWHEYEVRWTPDNITWLVDGQVGRTKQRSDTWNATANQWNFPQTPARVQISIWPGGASSNAPGTIAWAGGAIDWDSPDIQNYGYDFATFGQIEVECYNATSAPGTNTGVSYTYDSTLALNNSVVDGTKATVLKSFADTGLDMDAGSNSSSASASGSSASKTGSSAPAASVPGGDSSGPGSAPGQASGGSSGSSSSSSAGCQATGFSQNCGSSSSSSGNGKSAAARLEGTTGARALAGLVAVAFAGLLFV